MIQLSARWGRAIRRFRGLLLTGCALALGTVLWTEEAEAQFLGQDFTSGNAQGATATGTNSTAVGASAFASGNSSTAIGSGSQASGPSNPVSIGRNSRATGASYSLAIGTDSQADGNESIAVGGDSRAFGGEALALGTFSRATHNQSTALGFSSQALNVQATAIGNRSIASFIRSTALGYNSTTTRADQMMFGTATDTYTVPGIMSAASINAQSGSGQFVTSDASGNLALTNTTGSRVGFGTFAPDANSRLDIRSSMLNNGLLAARNDAGPHFLRVENPTSAFRCGVQGDGNTQFGALTPGKGLNLLAGGTTKLLMNSTGQISFGNAPPAITDKALVHTSGAHLTLGGVWTSVSSRAAKQDIEPITSEQARDTVRALQPVGYRYKNELDERYVGFIAEDVPELVATNDRKGLAPMDITAVLTKVVQDQQTKLEKQEAMITALTERLEAIERANATAPKRD